MKVKFLLLALVIALVSCNKDDDNNQDPELTSYLKVGNQWVYELSVTSQEFTMNGDFMYEVMEEMDNGTFRVVETTEIPSFPIQTETYFWTESDVFNIGHDMSNVSVGDTWDEIEDGVTYTTEVVAKGQNVTVPAGTFSCTKLKSTQSDDDTETYAYFNDSYGMIKMEATIVEEEEGVVVTVEMEMNLKSKNF